MVMDPIEDRIISIIGHEPLFTIEMIRERMPQESERIIYRAVAKLEKSGRIRFIRWQDRKKVFTSIGVSNLPYLSNKNGENVVLSKLLDHAPTLHNSEGEWYTALENTSMLTDILLLFAIAEKDGRELKDAWNTHQQKLVKHRANLVKMTEWIDDILKHPSMSGDMEYFKEVFNGNDQAMPSPEKLTEFKRWLSAINREKSKNNASE